MGKDIEQGKAAGSFNEKVKKGQYGTEEVLCLCSSGHYLHLSNHDRYGLWSPVVICKQCGLIYANPRLTEEAYRDFYSSDEYRSIYEGEGDHLESARHRYEIGSGKDIFDAVFPFMNERRLSTVMEFGCGGGWNLIHFLHAGYEVTGYDYSPSLIELGKGKGLNLIVGSFGELKGRYDLIILNHVIEHFTDLSTSIKILCDHLNPSGVLFIAVPNMDHFYMGQLQNGHTYYFTPRTFKHYLALNGLKIIQFGSVEGIHMYGIFEISKNPIQCHISLNHEFPIMKRKVQQGILKAKIGTILDSMGIGQIVRKSYHHLSSRS